MNEEVETYTIDKLLSKKPIAHPDEFLSWIFHGTAKQVNIAKKFLSIIIEKRNIHYDHMERWIHDEIAKKGINPMLFLMTRHEYHKVLYILEQVGFVEKKRMIWKISEQLPTRIKAMLRQSKKLQGK